MEAQISYKMAMSQQRLSIGIIAPRLRPPPARPRSAALTGECSADHRLEDVKVSPDVDVDVVVARNHVTVAPQQGQVLVTHQDAVQSVNVRQCHQLNNHELMYTFLCVVAVSGPFPVCLVSRTAG